MKGREGRAAELTLLLITIVWGSSFAVAGFALDSGLSPLLILLLRFSMSAVFLGGIHAGRLRRSLRREHLLPGLALGAVFLLAFLAQLTGLKYSTPSNNAMITAANVVLVPFVAWMATGSPPGRRAVLSCVVSLAGICVISVDLSGGAAFHKGDLLSMLSALLFAAQIVGVGELARRIDYCVLVFLEFSGAAVLALLALAVTGDTSWRQMSLPGGLAVLYLGLVCTCFCFLLQARAMRRVHPARGAVIMSTEAIFGSLIAILAGMDVLSARIVVGGLLLFCSVAWPQAAPLADAGTTESINRSEIS